MCSISACVPLTEQEKGCNDSHLKVQTQILDKPAGGALIRCFCYVTIVAASRFHEHLPGFRSNARALFLEARSREILQLVREGLHDVINNDALTLNQNALASLRSRFKCPHYSCSYLHYFSFRIYYPVVYSSFVFQTPSICC